METVLSRRGGDSDADGGNDCGISVARGAMVMRCRIVEACEADEERSHAMSALSLKDESERYNGKLDVAKSAWVCHAESEH